MAMMEYMSVSRRSIVRAAAAIRPTPSSPRLSQQRLWGEAWVGGREGGREVGLVDEDRRSKGEEVEGDACGRKRRTSPKNRLASAS